MPRKQARLIKWDEDIVHVPMFFANELLDSGEATFVSDQPKLTVRLVPIQTIRSVLIPQNCRNFRTEVIANCDKMRTGRPFGITTQEYFELRRLAGDGYVKPPSDFGCHKRRKNNATNPVARC